MKNQSQILKEKGLVYCKKHPEKWFDPMKFTGCYYCHLEEKYGEDWKNHIGEENKDPYRLKEPANEK